MTVWKQKVKDRFDRFAESYTRYNDVQNQIGAGLIERLPDGFAPKRILEIGCGDGGLTAMLVNRFAGAEIVATDISAAMLEQLARRDLGVEMRCIDGEQLDGTLGAFDLIISNMTVQWFDDYAAATMRWREILRPGGVIAVSRPHAHCFEEWQRALHACGFESGLLDYQAAIGAVEEATLIVPYGTTWDFLQHLKQSGVTTARAGYKPLSVAQIRQACAACDAMSQGRISWHILYERLDCTPL